MNTKRQFRVLYRQSLFRLMDVELLAGSAGGDASQLLGQFGALLIFGSLLLSFGAVTIGQAFREICRPHNFIPRNRSEEPCRDKPMPRSELGVRAKLLMNRVRRVSARRRSF